MSKNNLTPDEVAVIQMALSGMIEDLETVGKDPTIPFTPEARKHSREILTAAKSAHMKMAKASGMAVKLDKYNEGDENEFFTKQS